MSLFSFLRKNKQEDSASGDREFYTRTEEDSKAVRSRGKRKQGNQAAEPVDPVLPEKKRARRRLVGALALVLAVVIGLPMVLDSEPKPLADDISIQIPSQNKPAAPSSHKPAPIPLSKVPTADSLDKAEETVAMPAASAAVATLPPIAAVANMNTGKNEVKPVKDEHKPAAETVKQVAENTAPNPPASVKADAKAMVKPASSVQVAKIESKAAPSAAVQDEAVRAKAILEGKSDSKAPAAKAATDKKSGTFAVQVAALATKEKIDELQTKLRNAGIQTYTQKVATESGDRTRIRVGPFASKEDADKMRAKLNKLGVNGTLVPPVN